MPMLNVQILAAGKGTRIGTPKWRMLWHGERFLDVILHNLQEAGITDIHVIMNGEEVGAFKSDYPHLSCFVNHEPEHGMISSIRIGVEQSPPTDGYMIIMVDHPFVKAETYSILQDTFLENSTALIKPVYDGTPGHPVIVPSKVFENGFCEDENITLRDMIIDSQLTVLEVIVNDPGICHNVNNIEDLVVER